MPYVVNSAPSASSGESQHIAMRRGTSVIVKFTVDIGEIAIAALSFESPATTRYFDGGADSHAKTEHEVLPEVPDAIRRACTASKHDPYLA